MHPGLRGDLYDLPLGAARDLGGGGEARRSRDEQRREGMTLDHVRIEVRAHPCPLPHCVNDRNRTHFAERLRCRWGGRRINARRENAFRRPGGLPTPSCPWRPGQISPERSGLAAI